MASMSWIDLYNTYPDDYILDVYAKGTSPDDVLLPMDHTQVSGGATIASEVTYPLEVTSGAVDTINDYIYLPNTTGHRWAEFTPTAAVPENFTVPAVSVRWQIRAAAYRQDSTRDILYEAVFNHGDVALRFRSRPAGGGDFYGLIEVDAYGLPTLVVPYRAATTIWIIPHIILGADADGVYLTVGYLSTGTSAWQYTLGPGQGPYERLVLTSYDSHIYAGVASTYQVDKSAFYAYQHGVPGPMPSPTAGKWHLGSRTHPDAVSGGWPLVGTPGSGAGGWPLVGIPGRV